MKKFKYLKVSKAKKLRYIDNFGEKLYIVFLPGFMSDVEGVKPNTFRKYAIKKKFGFLALEYTGHGKSSGKFTDGNISIWTRDSKKLIKKIVKRKNFILIGSSMGSWISLNLFQFFKKQIKGFIGIGSAPEFLDKLMWKKFPKKIKDEIINNGLSIIKSGNYEYPISYQLIKDGRKNKILSKKIRLKIQVSMFHGKKDEVVPVSFSRKVLNLFPDAKKKIIIIKDGDHSLSQIKNLKKIIAELNRFSKNII